MRKSIAARFPAVAALLNLRADDGDEAIAPVEGEEGNEGDAAEGEGDEGEAPQDPPADEGTDGQSNEGDDGVDGENGGNAPAEGTAALAAGASDAQLLSAFDADAGRLVAAERDRCIAAFCSDAGRANPEGCSMLLAETEMSAEKIAATLATGLGAARGARGADRARLNASNDAKPSTGAPADTDGRDAGPVAQVKARIAARNDTAEKRGGRRANARKK